MPVLFSDVVAREPLWWEVTFSPEKPSHFDVFSRRLEVYWTCVIFNRIIPVNMLKLVVENRDKAFPREVALEQLHGIGETRKIDKKDKDIVDKRLNTYTTNSLKDRSSRSNGNFARLVKHQRILCCA